MENTGLVAYLSRRLATTGTLVFFHVYESQRQARTAARKMGGWSAGLFAWSPVNGKAVAAEHAQEWGLALHVPNQNAEGYERKGNISTKYQPREHLAFTD